MPISSKAGLEIPFAAYSGPDPYAFVSYSHKDSREVFKLLQALESAGVRLWYDQGSLSPGDDWRRHIDKYMHRKNCRRCLLFVSEWSMRSTAVQGEFRTFLQRQEETRESPEPFRIVPTLLGHPSFERLVGHLEARQEELEVPVEGRNEKDQRDLHDVRSALAFLRDEVGAIQFYRPANILGVVRELGDEVRDQIEVVDVRNLGIGHLKPGLSQKRRELIADRAVTKARTSKSYLLENLFHLTSSNTQAKQRLQRVRQKRALPGSTPEPWQGLLSRPLTIRTAFLSPLRLTRGLLTQYDQNWPPMVEGYLRLSKGSRNLKDFHYFIGLCWLIWGPSVPTWEMKNQRFFLLQAAYGDEANSWPLIIDRAYWDLPDGYRWDARLPGTASPLDLDDPDHRDLLERGILSTVRGLHVVRPSRDPYFDELTRDGFLEDLFRKQRGLESDELALYLPWEGRRNDPRRRGVSPRCAARHHSVYSTAYIWLILEQADEHGRWPDRLDPERLLPFFEHANLASQTSIEFLMGCLARKAIHHVMECGDRFGVRPRYRFATALYPRRASTALQSALKALGADGPEADALQIPPETEWWSAKKVVDYTQVLFEALDDA